MNRREFLLWVITTSLVGNEASKIYNKFKSKKTISDIFNLKDDVHLAEYKATSKGIPLSMKGMGIIYDDYYLSMAHIPNSLDYREQRLPFGTIRIPLNPKNKSATVMKSNLETLVANSKTDVFIGKPGIKIKNFPCEAKRDVKLSEEVYLIGNPELKGFNIRKGYVSDLDGFGDIFGKAEYTFGVDFPIHPGDSGCPVVNKDFKLLGLANYVVAHKFGYISKIGLYLDEIKNIKEADKIDKLVRNKH